MPVPGYTAVPANAVSWADLRTVFGTRGPTSRCFCQRFKLQPRESFASYPAEDRAHRLRVQADCGHPESGTTSGLVAYLDDEPVGWCAVEPRTAYGGLLRFGRVAWADRAEDKSDDGVWAVTCFVTRARAVEGYPITTKNVILEELGVGTEGVFAAAGFTEVSRPTLRRVVMRIDF